MPEGDTLFALAAQLRPVLAGKTLSRTDFRVPRLATADLSGWRVDEVRSVGKHLLVEVSDGDRRAVIRSHLGMDGSWRVFEPGRRWTKPGHTARAVLRVDGAEVVGFALRELHVDRVGPGRPDPLAHLGPDLLGADWDPARALAHMADAVARDPSVTVSRVLLDQRVMAGVGNIYRNEICFLLGVHPTTPMRVVDAEEAVSLARRLLWHNRLRPVRTTTGLPGRADLWVYGRADRPCRRCGTPIRRVPDEDRDRIAFYCPSCQPPDR
ncbi:Fpg/Nei family DNA glycosylase [Gordonia crocea]|uniref:DNA-(apurinic or apyrimidinic site) lyase n=1 Tax=Gordonia crocea TaxID=589162 RepID=A0A7I9UVU0_9ACTN|nr:Fpg/Nei family DNA glycosylase [Gordonia crocea]GED97334.1 putative endonuclease 8 2 [Gordonia crocea]